jgi:hypothetical protein
VAAALNSFMALESKIRQEDPTMNELAPPFRKAKRAFNAASSTGRIHNCDARNIPEALKQLGVPRPQGIGLLERENNPDFFLLHEEQRPNMPPFLVFSSLTGNNFI